MKHDILLNAIKDAIKHEPLFVEHFDNLEYIEFNSNDNTLEIRGQKAEDELTRFKMLLLLVNDERQMGIPNIYLPDTMQKKGLGMKMLEIIFSFAVQHDYELFIVDMVPSFYNKMLRKGAIPVDDFETVQIVSSTRLYSNRE